MQSKSPNISTIKQPLIDLEYEIEIRANPEDIWPWIKQVGYHRGGWYIDTWWDKFSQKYFWPYIVPKEARGTYKAPADQILTEYQNIKIGDIIPDGPPDSAYYEVVGIEENHFLELSARTHFNYLAPRFIYKTRLAPRGQFCWIFILEKIEKDRTQLTSKWQAEGFPKLGFLILRPILKLIDSAHQRQILFGIKRRVEKHYLDQSSLTYKTTKKPIILC